MPQGISSGPGPPWESAGPLYLWTRPPGNVRDPHGHEPDPWDESQTPLCGVRATHSKVPELWDKEYPGLNQDQARVRSRHVSGPYRVRFCSPLRRRPDAATWPTTRDVSRRAEPDVRPLGHATPTWRAKCRRENFPAGWQSAPALNPKMRKGLKCFACPTKRWSST